MLVSLEIKNFLLIKKISINFINGFNAFTGETGAGKSIIIEGLKLALGLLLISIGVVVTFDIKIESFKSKK